MRVILAGSRTITDIQIVRDAVKESGYEVTKVISGGARGVDTLGKEWGIENNLIVLVYPADWIQYGKRAGFLRNEHMALNADALIAIWDGESKGTAHMISIARKYNLRTYIKIVTN